MIGSCSWDSFKTHEEYRASTDPAMNWSTEIIYVSQDSLPITISYKPNVKPFYKQDSSYCEHSDAVVKIVIEEASPTAAPISGAISVEGAES